MKNNNKEFLDFIDEEVKQETIKDNELKQLLLLVPYHYHNFVINRIETVFKGDIKAYKKTITLFLEKFTRNDKAYAEATILANKNNFRKISKKRKQKILWAGQLLGAVGGKKMSAVAPFPVINEYEREMEEQEEFCRKNKLLNSAGKKINLTTPKQRKLNRYADSTKRMYAMVKRAEELKYKFLLLTFTLPPVFHPNPSIGRNSYDGATPQLALDTINHFWALYRSNLAELGLSVGDDFFGFWAKEGHKDSCIHKHSVIFVDPKKIGIYEKVFYTLMANERKRLAKHFGMDLKKFKMKWDFKIDETGKANTATYLFKYLSPDINNKETVANDALFSAYGSRRVQFFGENSKISVFRHLVRNWKQYEHLIEDKDVVSMLENKDLYLFNTKYQEYFKNVSVMVDGKRKYLGVSYVPGGKDGALFKKEILIEKKQYVVLENQDKATIKQYKDMTNLKFDDDVELYNTNLSNLMVSFPLAQKKQSNFNELLVNYYQSQFVKGFDNFVSATKCFYTQTNDVVIKQYQLETLEEQKKVFELNGENDYFKEFHGIKEETELELDINTEFLLLTLKHCYSSKNPSGFCFSLEKPKIPINEEELLEVLN